MRTKWLLITVAVVVILPLVAACATPTPEVIKEVVTQVVEVEKEVTKIVAGTPVVEKVVETKVVEKEITKVVKETIVVEKVVTPTPVPMPQVLRIAAEAEPRVLDPSAPAEGMGDYVLRTVVGEPLFEYTFDEKMEIQPLLATDQEWVDETTLAITLRQGVKFHNGKELTMEDVKYTYERVADKDVGSRYRSYVAPIKEIEIVDDYHGLFKVDEPYAPLTTYVLEYIMIVPKGAGDELKTQPIGTGPFKFKEWVKGEKAIFVKNEDYWQPGKPKLDEVIWQFQPEYQTRLTGLRAGDTDIVYEVQPSDVVYLEKEPGIKISPNLLLGTFYVGFNVTKAPFDDANMRQAVRYGIDKQLVLDTGQGGQGATKDIQEPMNSPFYTDKFDYERDFDTVKEYLDKAGYDGSEVELLVPNTPREGPFGDAVAFSLIEAGINVKETKLPVAEFIDLIFVKRDYQFMVCGYGSVPDPDYFHYAYFHSGGSNNIFLYNNPTVDQLLEAGRATLDDAERQGIYEELFKILMTEDVPVVSLVQSYRPMAVRSYVKGFKWNPLIRADLRDVSIGE